MPSQPPSGGCVLKLSDEALAVLTAFQPPSGGCVLKRPCLNAFAFWYFPAAFGRLCVETWLRVETKEVILTSRLRAAVC